MNDEQLAQIHAGRVRVVLDELAGTDFVIRTPEEIVVGGMAEAHIGDAVLRHFGAGGWTRFPLGESETSAESEPAATSTQFRPAPAAPAPPAPAPASAPAPAPPVIRAAPPAAPSAPRPEQIGRAAPTPPQKVQSLEIPAVMVRGLRCQRDHHVHPAARICPLCGDNMQNRSIIQNTDGSIGELGPRPPLGVLTLPDGRSFQLSRSAVVGRQPDHHAEVAAGAVDPVMVPGEQVSRAHAMIWLIEWDVFIEDLGSANGTRIGAQRLSPGERVLLKAGTDIRIGDRTIRFDPTSAAARL